MCTLPKILKVWCWTRSISAASGKSALGLMRLGFSSWGWHGWVIPAVGRSNRGGFLFCWLYRNRGPRAGGQALTLRVLDQVEDTREKTSPCVRLTDIDDRRVREFLAKNIKDQAARILIEVIDCFVENYPVRLVQQQPGEGELVLILGGQFPLPAGIAIDVRRQMTKLQSRQRGHVVRARELGGLRWISKRAA